MRRKLPLWSTVLALALSITDGAHAQTWPDLTILDNYPNPFGSTCTVDGNPHATAEKKARNRLKNRFTLPEHVKERRLDEVVALPPGEHEMIPAINDSNQNVGVSVIGYVRAVYPGGTRGESCNCNARLRRQVDAHIDLVLFPNEGVNDPSGRGVLVIEVTERSRRLAAMGLLSSNIGTDWSTSSLKSRLQGRWVKFTGWLFYDPDHHTGSWRVDPDNNEGENNWRATCWEVHPVMGIEVLEGRPANIPKNRPQ